MVGILHSCPRSGHSHLGTLVDLAVVERHSGGLQCGCGGIGGEVLCPLNLLDGHATGANDVDVVVAREVAEEHLVGLAVGQQGVAVATGQYLNTLNTVGTLGSYNNCAVAIGKDAHSTVGRLACCVNHACCCKIDTLAKENLAGSLCRSVDACIADDGSGVQHLAIVDFLVGKVPDVGLCNNLQLGSPHGRLRNGCIPPAGVASLFSSDVAGVVQVELTGTRTLAGVNLQKYATLCQCSSLIESSTVNGQSGRNEPTCTYIVVVVARAYGSVRVGGVAHKAYELGTGSLTVAILVHEDILGTENRLGSGLGPHTEDTCVVRRGLGGGHKVEGAILHLNEARIGAVANPQEGTSCSVEGGVLNYNRGVNTVTNIDEVTTYRTGGIYIVNIATVNQNATAVSSCYIVVVEALGVAKHLAINQFKSLHRSLGGEDVALGLGTFNGVNRTVENEVFKVNGGYCACGLNVQTGYDGFLTIGSGLTNHPEVAADCCCAGKVVCYAIVVLKFEFNITSVASDGAHNSLNGIYGVEALVGGTGEGGHTTTITSLAVDEAQLVVGAGLQAANGSGACGNHLGGEGQIDTLLRAVRHGGCAQCGEVVCVLALAPSDSDALLGTVGYGEFERAAHSRGCKCLLEVGPVRVVNTLCVAFYAYKVALVNLQSAHNVRDFGDVSLGFEGLSRVVIGGQSHLLACLLVDTGCGGLKDLHRVVVGTLHCIPSKFHISTYRCNNLCCEVGGGKATVQSDAIHNLCGLADTADHSQRRSSSQCYISNKLFHSFSPYLYIK